MKIYSMTATFGKLEHETLTLKPGLNIIEAPNEWGKSTWCAFLVNMLYGIDTRARSTGAALADKECYAPWSGSPMAGRIDLNWNGRDITIERRTRGRVIFGDFQAYETDTGMDIPELNGANCGQTLLGVERSVFTRAGFLKLSEMPVTQDDALRRRLNNLVTTGDESGAGDRLAQTLKDLKNKCRHNRTGLLPQAETERDQLKMQLEDLQDLNAQAESIRARQSELDAHISRLKNHQDALQYAKSQNDARQVAQAIVARDEAKEAAEALAAQCGQLSPEPEAEQALRRAKELQEQLLALQMEVQMLPPMPEQPEIPAHYQNGDAVAAARTDAAEAAALEKQKKHTGIGWIVFAVIVLLAVAAAALGRSTPVLIGAGAAIGIGFLAVLITSILRTNRIRNALQALYDRHPGLSPDMWIADAEAFEAHQSAYWRELSAYQQVNGELDARRSALNQEIAEFTGGKALTECQNAWQRAVDSWAALGNARRDLQKAESMVQAVQSMAGTAQAPAFPDTLSLSESETAAQLENARLEHRQLHLKLGQCLGQAEALGQESLIKARLDTLNRRISRLEDTYSALEMAQEALREATTNLQRRFAPRISKRAQELFGRLTGGRYQRITLGEDLSLSACAENEETLRSSQWRSDGTVDQLYLALRLAVAEELTPEAPLLLDDALVRFDDRRLTLALEILQEEAKSRQVILFTCQGREGAIATNRSPDA